MYVGLHDFRSLNTPAVRHGYGDGDFVVFGEDCAADCRCAVGEGGVGQTVAEGEKRVDAESLVVTVSDV